MTRPRAGALTPRRLDVLCAIASSVRARGYPPTTREIGDRVGLRSTNAVHDHLDRLIGAGLISRDHTPRSIRITIAGWALLGPQQQSNAFRAERAIERLEMGA